MSVFGDYVIRDTLSIPIYDGIATFKRISNEHVLLLINRKGITYSKLFNLEYDEYLSIRPISPQAGSLRVDCLYLKLMNELVLKPGDTVRLNALIPLDLGVYVNSILVEALPLSKVKYALYGPPDLGDLCRFVDLGKNQDSVKAELEICFESKSENTSKIQKVVLPMNGLSVYKGREENLKFQSIDVVVYSEFHVEVITKTETPEGFSLFSFIKPERNVYVMRYGV